LDSDHIMDTNEQDPDSLAADHMNIDENADMIEFNLNLDDLVESATLESIKISLDFIQELKAISLDNGHLSPEVLSRLKNPPSDAIDLTAGENFSLRPTILHSMFTHLSRRSSSGNTHKASSCH